jgi:short-subunit dehydrogenase
VHILDPGGAVTSALGSAGVDLSGKRVVVTGASRGIGRVMVDRLGALGARLALVARTAAALEPVAAGLTGATIHPCELGDAAQVAGLIGRIEAEGGPVDVLVNNAGIDTHWSFVGADADAIRRVYEVNLLAPAELCRQVLPGMVARGRGHIVNVSSLAGVAPFPGLATYASSKAGLSQLTAGLRADLRGTGVRTTLAELGPVPTEMLEGIGDYAPTRRSFQRWRRLGLLPETSTDAVADAVVAAIVAERRHVRLPKRARPFALMTEAPRRIVEICLVGVPRS